MFREDPRGSFVRWLYKNFKAPEREESARGSTWGLVRIINYKMQHSTCSFFSLVFFVPLSSLSYSSFCLLFFISFFLVIFLSFLPASFQLRFIFLPSWSNPYFPVLIDFVRSPSLSLYCTSFSSLIWSSFFSSFHRLLIPPFSALSLHPSFYLGIVLLDTTLLPRPFSLFPLAFTNDGINVPCQDRPNS